MTHQYKSLPLILKNLTAKMQVKQFLLIATLSLFSANSHAKMPIGNPEFGPLKTPSCGFCHGVNGIGTQETYPNLQGQKADYLFNSMKSYQAGQRKGALAEMMQQQLSRLSDQDLADIAVYYEKMPAIEE